MKKVSTFLFLLLFAGWCLNCTKSAANENSNQINVNTTAGVAETNRTNASVKAAKTPVPTFTNADEALSEGKKLLDDLETEKAIDALSQAAKLNPDLAEAHFNLGIAYALVEKEEAEKAITQVEATPTPKATKKTKKNAPPPRTKNSEKAFDNAVKAYKKILSKNPKDDVSYFNLGRAYNKLNEDDDALEALEEAVKLKSDDYEYQMELGAVLMKLAQYEDAAAALKKALTLDPNNLQAEDLLEKAEAGRKRVEFGNQPKPPPPPPSGHIEPRRIPKSKDAAGDEPRENPKPSASNANKQN